MLKSMTFWAVVAGCLAVVGISSLFIVRQTEQVIVVQFGEIVRVVKEPGLKAKVPFIQNVIRFDNRLLEFEAPPAEFITRNRAIDVEERVVIDAFVRYRIIDPVQFYQAVKNEANLRSRMASIVTSGMRRTIANYSLSDLLSDKRQTIMQQIQHQVNRQAMSGRIENAEGKTIQQTQGFGIEVVDVRIMRADLPSDISLATYERMRKDFTKEAQRFRAEGGRAGHRGARDRRA
jgi:membrane protease subunit HflC